MANKSIQQIDRLAEWLRLQKQETGWSYPEISRRSGLSQGTPANIINKRYDTVDARTVKGLAKAFSITEQELWEIINGVVEIQKASHEAREILLPAPIWRLLDTEARRCGRNWDNFLEVVCLGYFGVNTNLDIETLTKLRRTDALLIPSPDDGTGELPFTTEDTSSKRLAKQQATKKARSG